MLVLLFLCFCFLFLLLFFVCFFGGFKDQARWPEGPPQSALNPPYLLFLFVCLFFCFCLFFLFWATSPGPKPFLFSFCFFFFLFFGGSFCLFVLIEKETCFPPKKGIFVVNFSVFPFVCV